MADNRVETTVLVLTGESGELYAIPQEDLERYRVSDEQRAELEQQWDDEVSGYSMYQSYLSEKAASHNQAELHRRGEEIRHKADYARLGGEGDEAETSSGIEAEPHGVRRFFTGVLATLRLAPVRVSKEP